MCMLSHVWLFCDPVDFRPPSLLCLWVSPGKNTTVGCHLLLRGIFLTQGSNPGLLHCRQILYQNLSHWGSPIEPELLPFHYFRQQFFPLWNRSPDSFQFQSHCSLCFPSAIVFILKAFSSTSPNSFSSRASPWLSHLSFLAVELHHWPGSQPAFSLS